METSLLDAAEAVFIEGGYARATFDAIARAAGVTRRTIYLRYRNMEAILSAVIKRLADQTPGTSEPLPPAALEDPRALLLGVAHALISVAETPRAAGMGRLFFAEAYQSPDLIRVLVDLHARTLNDLRRILEPLREAGHLPLMPEPEIAASIFLEMVLSVARSRAIFGAPWPRNEMAAQTAAAVDVFLRGCGFELRHT